MTDAYVGEIRIFGGNFAPVDWQFCDGQLLSISEYETLYALIGTTYGGDGQNTFALPDLRGRTPVHVGNDGQGNTYMLGSQGGVENVTLTSAQMPSHTHPIKASSNPGTAASPSAGYFATSSSNQYSDAPRTGSMAPGTITPQGGNQPHNNMMPSLALNFIIATQGYFPSQS
ncbi:phage tail protein [Saccharibacillus brassicae]|uniref:Phage tail protein n=1 Tax=Saccharibacillus brassicae TaxID=2583377 RepID=A0A4Y6UUW2_SACBS|nr:tail fiber protein [Saccharibacillus brassicae]QDH20348.1 phage tail protein [Saccharibacillus brassicae]